MKFLLKILKSTVTKIVLLIMILAFLLCLFVFWGWFEKQFNKCVGFYYVYQGDKAYKRGKLEKAIKFYRQGLDKYPEHSIARCNLGNIYVKYEDYTSAVTEYEKALEYDPKFIVCRMNLGIVSAEKLADYDTAIREYRTIIETKRVPVHIPLIYNNVKSTRDNKSIAWYNMGIAYRGKSLLMGEKTRASDMYLEKAIECYKKALKRHKKSYNVNFNYAVANHLLGNYREAGLGYCKAIELEPMAFDAHYNLSILLRHLKKYPESIEELEKASLIVDNTGDPYIAKYMFEVMRTITEKYAAQSEAEDGTHPKMKKGFTPDELQKKEYHNMHIVTEKVEDTGDPMNEGYITYVNGKATASKDAEKYFKKVLANAAGKNTLKTKTRSLNERISKT